jgi:hypothetical protein
MKTTWKRAVAGVAGAAAVSGALVVGTAGAASAEEPQGVIRVCAQGDYRVSVEFSNRRGKPETLIVDQGVCRSFLFGVFHDGPNHRERIVVKGRYNTSGTRFDVGAQDVNVDQHGVAVSAKGSANNHTAYAEIYNN